MINRRSSDLSSIGSSRSTYLSPFPFVVYKILHPEFSFIGTKVVVTLIYVDALNIADFGMRIAE